jgi:hypothetical protein
VLRGKHKLQQMLLLPPQRVRLAACSNANQIRLLMRFVLAAT